MGKGFHVTKAGRAHGLPLLFIQYDVHGYGDLLGDILCTAIASVDVLS